MYRSGKINQAEQLADSGAGWRGLPGPSSLLLGVACVLAMALGLIHFPSAPGVQTASVHATPPAFAPQPSSSDDAAGVSGMKGTGAGASRAARLPPAVRSPEVLSVDVLSAELLIQEALSLPAGLPVSAPVTSAWGMRMHPIKKRLLPHHGVDLGCPTGTRVAATADGVVTSVSRGESAGLNVRVGHVDGYSTWYAHLDSVLVKRGERVRSGDAIALSGATGAVTGAHLHYEVNWGGRLSDSLSVPIRSFDARRSSMLDRADSLLRTPRARNL